MINLEIGDLNPDQIHELEKLAEAFRLKNNEMPETVGECFEKVKPIYFIKEDNVIYAKQYSWGDSNHLPSENHCIQTQAIWKEMVVAKAINGEWEPDYTIGNRNEKWWIYITEAGYAATLKSSFAAEGFVCFKSEQAAKKAARILGRETLKQARGMFI